MIIPYPQDIRALKNFPLTITLVALNVLLFVMIFSGPSKDMSDSVLLERDALTLTGRLYHQYYETLPVGVQATKPEWIHSLDIQDLDHLGVLGAYALRDADFVALAEKREFRGDTVQIAQWRKDFAQFRKNYQQQILYRFGLSSTEMKPSSWITYQFSHSNWMHLVSNLLFLIVMGMAVEGLVGSAGLLVLYILGGLMGGAGFLYFDSHGTVPMVGASASISALLAFYCLAEPRTRIRFVYFVSPMPQYYGAIFLPTLLMIPLFLVSDVANLWSTPSGLGAGVAYAAHLGGAVLGAGFGFLYRYKKLPQWHNYLPPQIVKYFS